MRKLTWVFILWFAVSGTSLVHSQSTFIFRNRGGGLDAPVFDAYGNRLAGTNYVAILYGGVTMDSLAVAEVATAPGVAMTPEPFTFVVGGFDGYFNKSDFVLIPSTPCGGAAWLQVRAWDARLASSYEDIVSLGVGGYGESIVFQKQGGVFCGPSVSPPEPLLGLQSFALREVIPEPNTCLLLLLALPALFFFRHRPT